MEPSSGVDSVAGKIMDVVGLDLEVGLELTGLNVGAWGSVRGGRERERGTATKIRQQRERGEEVGGKGSRCGGRGRSGVFRFQIMYWCWF